ncbi:MAG: ribosome biogenesis GTPase YlqF [Lachnospiraceae bacterium]
MKVQWYPGHMTKARRMMQQEIKLVDVIIEVIDARIPFASRNPDIDELGAHKPRIILLNKADLADDRISELWLAFFRNKGFFALKMNSRKNTGIKQIHELLQKACAEKIQRDIRRGIKNRPIRAMVVGIPNVGKSTFINTFAGRASTKTGNKPGVTKGKQWIRIHKSIELLDTPGILWPKFEDETVGVHLAMIGSVNDDILNKEELALQLLLTIMQRYPGKLTEYYGISMEEEALPVLEQIAQARNCIAKGNTLNYSKAADLILDDFRAGKIARISLEAPEETTTDEED